MRNLLIRRVVASVAVLSPLLALLLVPSANAATAGSELTTFIQGGDRICKEAALRLEGLVAKYETVKISGFRQRKGHRALPAQAAAYISEVALPETRKTLDSLRLLKAPAGNASDYKDLLSTLQADLDGLSKGKIDIVGGDLMSNSSKKFKAFGFTQCGSNSRPAESTAKK